MRDNRRLAYLKAMDIDVWVSRQAADVPAAEQVATAAAVTDPSPQTFSAATPVTLERTSTPPAADVNSLDLEALRSQVAGCTLCDLHQSRTQTVFGVGNPQAELMFIGEAPGADEDAKGEPFVGRAGQLLTAMLKAIGLQRDQVYIANILKCRPPDNRDPQPEEVAQCWPYLQRQIELINPKLIVALGRIAAHRLLQTNTSLARLRSQLHYLDNIPVPVVVTYHPAYLLRSPTEKRKAWEDLQFVIQQISS